jgi:TonB family protein
MKKDSYRLLQAFCIALVIDGMLGASFHGLLSLIRKTVDKEAPYNTSVLQVFIQEAPHTNDIFILRPEPEYPRKEAPYTNDISVKSERTKQTQSGIHPINATTNSSLNTTAITSSTTSVTTDVTTSNLVQEFTQGNTNGDSEDSGLVQGNQLTSTYMIEEITSEANILDEDALSLELHKILQEKIQSRLVYPLLARKQGIQGTVRFSVTIMPSGKSGGLQLLESSGSSILDRAAASSIEEIFPLEVQHIQWYKPIEIPIRITYTLDSQ